MCAYISYEASDRVQVWAQLSRSPPSASGSAPILEGIAYRAACKRAGTHLFLQTYTRLWCVCMRINQR
jgi:hypothetical protein